MQSTNFCRKEKPYVSIAHLFRQYLTIDYFLTMTNDGIVSLLYHY